MFEKFLKYLSFNCEAGCRAKIILAVSGGIDSMVMADLFSRTGYETAIAHCNFKLRGTDSDGDELFVTEYASRSGKPFFLKHFDTKGYAMEKSISIEMAARELRYQWFEEIRQNNGYDLIAVAHNLNDNVETFLINLTRGTGIAGLCGIKARQGSVIRPLLFATRAEIEKYAKINKVACREDKTNAELKFIRNRIRHRIIPLFRQINPSFDETITTTLERLGEIQEIVTVFIAEARRKAIKKEDKETVVFNVLILSEIRPFRTVLFELFRPYGISSGLLDGLADLILKGRTGAQLHTGSHRILRNRNEIIVLPAEGSGPEEYLINNISDLQKIPFIREAAIVKKSARFRIINDPDVACLDAGSVSFPLIIRRWRHGDRFCPFGMTSFRKLSDYFTDRKYSVSDKEKVLLIESAGNIVWIIGERIDDRFKVTGSTRSVLIIKAVKT